MQAQAFAFLFAVLAGAVPGHQDLEDVQPAGQEQGHEEVEEYGPGGVLFFVPDGDATVQLTLRMPDDASGEEKLGLVGKELELVGRSELAHGPGGETLRVTVDGDLSLRGSALHQWIYELRVAGQRGFGRADGALGPFLVQRDQFFYPRRGEHLDVAIELVRWQDLSGIVVDAAGEPVAGARVVASWGRRSIHGLGIRETRQTDASGRFLFERMPPDVGNISAETAPWERARLHGDDVRERVKGSGVRLVLKVDEAAREKAKAEASKPTTRHTLTGVVSGLSAAALVECVVCFAPTDKLLPEPSLAQSMLELRWRRKAVVPDPESGAFVLEGVMWGPTTVWAEIPHGGIVRRSERVPLNVAADTAPVELSMPASCGMEGQVLQADGLGLQGAVVTFEQTSGSSILSRGQVTTDADGAFRLEGLPPGAYRASIEHDRCVLSGASARAEFAVLPGEVLEGVFLGAVQGGWIDLQVIHWTGQPITNPQVGFAVLSHRKQRIGRRLERPVTRGRFRLGPFEPGTYRVQRELRSVNRHGRVESFGDVEVSAGEVAPVVLDERIQAFERMETRCKGRVLIEGKPVLGIDVRISDEVGDLGRCYTNLEGEFELAVPRAGPLTLSARQYYGPSPRSASRTVELKAGETSTIEWSLRP